jgi:hypothetical protein
MKVIELSKKAFLANNHNAKPRHYWLYGGVKTNKKRTGRRNHDEQF